MSSLTGTKIKDTYDGLLKTSDNGAAGATYKELTDGLGNGLGLFVGTSGGVKFGTASDTTLGDYEEGSWTPQISNGTIDVAVSHTGSWYIKIGSLVTVSTRITNADLSSFALGDNPQIIGLPFTSSATSYSTVFLRGAVAGNILRYIQTVGSSSSILTDLTVSELVSGATDYFLTITYTV